MQGFTIFLNEKINKIEKITLSLFFLILLTVSHVVMKE